MERLQPLSDNMGGHVGQCRIVSRAPKIDVCTLCSWYVGSSPERPRACFEVFAGAVDHEKIGEYHRRSGLCDRIALVRHNEIDLCMPYPEVLDIVSVF